MDYNQRARILKLLKRGHTSVEPLENDREIVMNSVQIDGIFLILGSETLKNDRKIVLAAIQNNVYSIVFVYENLKNDRKIICKITQFGGAFYRQQNDFKMILEAVRKKEPIYRHLSVKMIHCRKIIRKVFQTYRLELGMIPKLLTKDRSIIHFLRSVGVYAHFIL